MLNRLTSLLGEKGHLSGLVIDEIDDMPSSSVYRSRFGSLLHAYQLVGYQPGSGLPICRGQPSASIDVPGHTGLSTPSQTSEASAAFVESDQLTDVHDDKRGVYCFRNRHVARCLRTSSGRLRWKTPDSIPVWRPDLTVAVRMDESNENVLHYYLLPSIDMAENKIRLAEENGIYLDAYRF